MANKFLIAPIEHGVESNMTPFMISDGAYEQLDNAYVYRGRVRKRFGSYLMNTTVAENIRPLFSRLRYDLGPTNPAGNILGNVGGLIYKIGQQFSIGTEIFTVTTAGAVPMITTGAATTHLYDTATGAYDIQGAAPATVCYFYPAEPVMGFTHFENTEINFEPLMAFDTQYSYLYDDTTGWDRLAVEAVGGDSVWTGTNSDFYWNSMYRGPTPDIRILFTTNYRAADGLRYFDGTTWARLQPAYTTGANNDILTARLIIPFYGRLLLFNTIETVGGVHTLYQNRCRFSQFGSPLEADAWRQDIPGKGNWIDAVTQEAIITAQIIKDRLIVYFERSTRELVFTGNHLQPFLWQTINVELGAESTFSMLPFDRNILGVGNVGIHKCNGAYVERIDEKIPDTVFQINNVNDSLKRVYAIRDYYNELVYWSYPAIDAQSVYPNKILIYNYMNDTWSGSDDSITVFGYYQRDIGLTWADMPGAWEDYTGTWADATFHGQFRNVVAGNQEGFTYIVDADRSRNAPTLQITNITAPGGVVTLYIRDHNLKTGDYILIENGLNVLGAVELNDRIYEVQRATDHTVTLPTIAIAAAVYAGRGTATRVDRILIRTKQYNFYNKAGVNLYLEKVNFNINRTTAGEITVDSAVSSSNRAIALDGAVTGALLGDNVLETYPYPLFPLEATQARLWHAIHFQSEGNVVQLVFYLTDAQMINPAISLTDFQLNAMIFTATPTQEMD